jgi:hypothetical protein
MAARNFAELVSNKRLFVTTQLAASVVFWLACWPLVPKIAGSNPAEKNPKHASLRKGSKGVGPVS